jgi:hypothetical protein
MRAIAVWFKDTPVGSPRQCADFVGQWREELLASIWTSGLTECHLWVKSAILTVGQPLPVYADQRTFSESVGMSQTCHERSRAQQQHFYLAILPAIASAGAGAVYAG